ncbi:Y381-like protein [Mya arenaria]|uniref:Y381-like protein n=1 Tax=Mya arenaria TaxID=6604 RepID=A0ABY7ERQ8_MYAAR|nr:Y381-like protein [Mya arenaria]
MKRTEELHRAIQVGLVPEVRRLVVQGADMDHVLGSAFTRMRGTSLCAAIEARSLEITKFLLTSGCDVNARDFDGEPPIMLAIRKAAPVLRKKNAMTLNFKPSIDDAACLEIVPIIINHKDCNLNKVDPITKQTAIHYAISEDLTGVVEMLMTSRCDVKCKVNSRDAGGKTALHLAVETGNINMVKHLLASDTCMEKVFTGEKVFVGFPFSREGLTVLHTCAKLGHTEIMQILVEKINGERKLIHEVKVERSKNQECVLLNLNAVTKFEKQTCLHLAARNGHEEIVCQLARWGASIDEKDSMNITPLLFSICSDKYWLTGDIAIPKLLLKMGAYPNIRASVRGFRFTSNPDLDLSPLNLAACNNDLELAKLLVKNVADVNQPDNMGNVPLYNALWSNSVSAAFYFLRDCPETNVNIQNVDGSTPLHAVVKITQTTAKSVNVIKDLVNCIFARGGRIASNNTGQTVFMNAFEYENHVLMDVVLEHNKTTFDQIEHGNEESMIEMLKRACELGLVEMLRVLLSHGADIDQKYEFRVSVPMEGNMPFKYEKWKGGEKKWQTSPSAV